MSAIVIEARRWLGTRYRHQGRATTGVDCAGLVIEVAKSAAGSTFDINGYARVASDESMLALCEQQLQRIARSAMRPGDVLVLAFEHQRHMAIVGDHPAGGLTLIHAYAPSRKVVEQGLDAAWLARVIGVYRFPEKT